MHTQRINLHKNTGKENSSLPRQPVREVILAVP
jgi:hypothetical protein